MAQSPIPLAICAAGNAGDNLARLVQQLLDRHLPDHPVIAFARPCNKTDHLLALLQIGLHSTDAHLLDTSTSTLRVRISQLRNQGYIIDSLPDPPAGHKSAVTYRLRAAPHG